MNDPYRRIARIYDTLVDPLNAALRSIGLKLAPPSPGMAVLEIGCGTGSNLVLYEREGCHVSGVDLSPSMLDVARAKLSDTADLRLCDAVDLPYGSRQFDLVTAFMTLHEMPSAVRAPVLKEMMRVASADGHLVVIDFHPGPVRFPRGWLFKLLILALERGAGREHFRNYRDFLSNRGIGGLIEHQPVTTIAEKVVSGGNVMACSLRPSNLDSAID